MTQTRLFSVSAMLLAVTIACATAPAGAQTINPAVDYTKPNYANSPILSKFIDSLPGLGYTNSNNRGQYIPVAIPDTTTYSGCDYYELGVQQYTQKLHSELPASKLRGYVQLNTTDATVAAPHYLGPMIIAHRDTPVRIKFTNMLATGTNGKHFLPVDTTIMGAGTGPLSPTEKYTENRVNMHLHGGFTPWISDGTPHQWTAPAGETTRYPKGVSTQDVPDMPAAGAGSMTFYYPNQQSARLQFYHDHTYGITRLNVYAGEAAGYIIRDTVEQGLITAGTIPADEVPLIIQDKTFVSATTTANDPLWNTAQWGGPGSLWFPHVYMPNQDPSAADGTNPMGRWDYGPWFWPPWPTTNQTLPTTSIVPEAFMDTPVVNGAAYPFLAVQRKAYRFRVLNACNDRSLNLQVYFADTNGTEVKMVAAVPHPSVAPAPTDGLLRAPDGAALGAVTGLPTGYWPQTWPTDARDGGVPDPTSAGPQIIQIGTEGGILRSPAIIPAGPINYDYNRRNIVVLNVSTHALFLGPAERADIIIDFSQVPAGSTLILYNDAPAPVPAFDPRYDYYTGDPDQTAGGGAPTTLVGKGPNTRTIMQFRVAATGTAATAYPLATLQTALPIAFAASQPPMLVPQVAYGATSNAYARIQDNSLTYTPTNSSTPVTIGFKPKAIQELFDTSGRMNATLGVEIPLTTAVTQTTIPYSYIDPPTEVINANETQIWKITHNGVDTHAIHFHLVNVQLINRVGWDGQIRPPDDNELGWKETIRMNPLEDVIVALKPTIPSAPFGVPDSIRSPDVTSPPTSTMGFTNVDTNGNPIVVTNAPINYGWEYVWHCHLLGHEENDMMRPLVMRVPPPAAPSSLTAGIVGPGQVRLDWRDNSVNEFGFGVVRATGTGNGTFAPVTTVGTNVVTFTDTSASSVAGSTYTYEVYAYAGADSPMSNKATVVMVAPAAPSNPKATPSALSTAQPSVTVTWKDNSTGESGFEIQRATNAAFTNNPITFTVGPNVTTYADPALTPHGTYYYRVRAISGIGNSAYTPTVSAATAGWLPATPTGLTVGTVTRTSVRVSWTDNSTNESGFYVQRSTKGTAGPWATVITAAANLTMATNSGSGVSPNTTYWYRIQSYDADGTSPASNVVSAKTLP
jgi:FtsP/CotA-like multicopper oxidase with cupredoxin domain